MLPVGRINLFDAFKKYIESDTLDAWIEITLDWGLGLDGASGQAADAHGMFTRNNVESVYNKTLDTENPCSVTMMLSVRRRATSCYNPRDAAAPTWPRGVKPEERQHYALDRYGFERCPPDENSNIWHRKNVGNCSLGCCDECFRGTVMLQTIATSSVIHAIVAGQITRTVLKWCVMRPQNCRPDITKHSRSHC